MKSVEFDRRNFLKMAMAAGVLASATTILPQFSLANVKTITMKACEEMSPEEMAQSSQLIMDSWNSIADTVKTISDSSIRTTVETILHNPAPTFMTELQDIKNRKDVYMALSAKGLIDPNMPFEKFLPPVKNPLQSQHTFIAAPGSGYTSHHSYPGGLVSHTALNTMMSLALFEKYQSVYGCQLNRDIVIASQVLHDLHKPWVFQWQSNGESRTELKLAGTGEHHIYSVAESIFRGLPAELCVAQACAHNHPGFSADESGPVKWLQAAAILSGKDPVKAGLLAPGEQTLPLPRRMENFVCHLGDHDWVLSVPAAQWLIPIMQEIAVEKYGMSQGDLNDRKFNNFRNYVFAQSSIMSLYHVYSSQGKDALSATVLRTVTA